MNECIALSEMQHIRIQSKFGRLRDVAQLGRDAYNCQRHSRHGDQVPARSVRCRWGASRRADGAVRRRIAGEERAGTSIFGFRRQTDEGQRPDAR